MRAIDADALQLAIVEEGQANKRKKYIIGDIWELTGAEIREVINSQPTIQPEIIYCGDGCKFWNRHTGEQKGTCYILRQCTSDGFYCGNAKRREATT